MYKRLDGGARMGRSDQDREQELAELLREVRALRQTIDELKVDVGLRPKLPPNYEVLVRTRPALPPDYAVAVRQALPPQLCRRSASGFPARVCRRSAGPAPPRGALIRGSRPSRPSACGGTAHRRTVVDVSAHAHRGV